MLFGLSPAVGFEVLVSDHQVDTAVNVILRYAVAHPSESGAHEHDGHLVLLHVDQIP